MRRDRRREIVQLDESDWTRPVKARSVGGSLACLAAVVALTAAPLIYVVWTAPIREGVNDVDNVITGLGRLRACIDPNIPAQMKTPECRQYSTTTTTTTGH